MNSNYGLKYITLTKDNVDIAYEIQSSVWPEDPDYGDLYDKATNTQDDNCFFLVYDKDSLVGITGVDLNKNYPDTIWLDWFAILPEQRRKGYGEKVLRDTIAYCKKLNRFKSFRVDTTYYENRPALFLYDKVMRLKEDYTIEDTDTIKTQTLIYSYPLEGPLEPWNNKYLGLREYYDNLSKE